MENTWVSFVWCNRNKGDSGIRGHANIYTEIPSRLLNNHDVHITDTDLTYDQAVNMLSLTPEICRFTDEIDTIYGQSNKLDDSRMKYILPGLLDAYRRVIKDRSCRKKYGYIPLENYLDFFVDVNAGNTGKYLVFRKLNSLFKIRSNGTIVNLKNATLAMCKELMSEALDNQMIDLQKELK